MWYPILCWTGGAAPGIWLWLMMLQMGHVFTRLELSRNCCWLPLKSDDGMRCSWHPVITAAAMQHCSTRTLQSPAGPGDITLPLHAASLCFVSGHNFLWTDPSQWHGAALVTPHYCPTDHHNTRLNSDMSWSTYFKVINNPHSYLWEHTLIINVSCQIVVWAES